MTTRKENILGKNLRELRQARDLKQEDVASALGVPSPTYSSWERGRTEPSVEGILRLARYFDVSLDRLLRSEPHVLRIGSSYPIGPDARFHPIKHPGDLYVLMYPVIFNRLYSFDVHERRFYVELIDSWYVDKNADRPGYTFYLRSNVSFHNGDELELEDVKSSYELLFERDKFFKHFIDEVTIIDEEHAIRLELKPGKWLELDALPAPYILPRSYADDDECFVGTGPFKLTGEQRNRLREGLKQPVVLESNNAYFGKIPSIKAIEFHRIHDPDKLKDSLKSGAVNMAVGVSLDEPDRFDVKYGVGTLPLYLIFRENTNEDLKKAVDLALDRQRIIDALGIEGQILSSHHLYLLLREAPSPQNNYDPANAKKHWEKAKSSLTRNGTTEFVLRIAPFYEEHKLMVDAVKEIVKQLGELGIPAELESDQQKADALVTVIVFRDYPSVYWALHSSERENRWWGYGNSYLDSLLDNIEGMHTYEEIQKVLTAEHLFIHLFRQRVPITHIKDLDTVSKFRRSDALYGPYVVHWKFI
jgi:ABC-type transport system substrate-binding protein/plasmid maintenance system antidote protein VapI